jgi:hypothetical protein
MGDAGTQQTWTFCGHWENDQIVIDYVLPGNVEDERVDTGRYEQGLWASSASGTTVAEAQEAAIAEYEGDDDEGGLGPQHEEAALRVFGAMHGYTR